MLGFQEETYGSGVEQAVDRLFVQVENATVERRLEVAEGAGRLGWE